MNKKGFTLIEIVTVIVILAIIGTFTISFLVDNSRTYLMMRTQNDLYQDGLYIIERISRDITDSNGTFCAGGFNKTHTSPKDAALCAIYSLAGTTLFRNGQPIGRNVSNFTTDYTVTPNTVSIILEKDCGMSPNKDGTVPKCKVDLSTSVLPMNTSGKFNGNYEEVIYQ